MIELSLVQGNAVRVLINPSTIAYLIDHKAGGVVIGFGGSDKTLHVKESYDDLKKLIQK